MAANMGMAGNSHLLMQQQQNNNNQRQMQQIVYNHLVQNTPAITGGGWQAGIPINDRLGKTLNLISNVMLAMPQAEWTKAASFSLEFEKKCFLAAPDRMTYDQSMAGKSAEMLRKRQAAAPALQNQLSAEAAARQQQQQQQQQAQAQAQAQQQMMMSQNAAIQAQLAARGIGQPGQQGFQHLRGPMQPSPIPQQPLQIGMGPPGLQQPQPNQPPFMMNTPQQRPVGGSLQDRLNSLPPQQRMHILDTANKMFANQTEESRQNVRNMVQSKMTQQQLAEYRSQNQDPLLMYYQNQALFRATKQQAQNMYLRQQQQQGMGPNSGSAQAAMLQQQQQQQQQLQQQQQQKQQMGMNPGMMNNLGLQTNLPGGQLFAPSMETIINEQKAGLLAEQSGQMVVPASNGPNRNATPQSMGGVGPQNMPNGQPGPNQQSRPPQMGQPFNLSQVKMNQAAAQSAAQNKAQAAAQQMQGQPGGLGGPASTSQSPAMNTLTAPMTHPPVALGGMGQVNGARFNQGNPAMGQVLDQRFNHQANTRPISMSGNINVNSAALNQMLSTMPVEKRQNVSTMPPDKLRELMASWEQQRNSMANGLMPQQPTPGQPQMSQMGNQFIQNPQQTPNTNMTQSAQQAMMQSARARVTAQAIAGNPQAQVMMDSMDVPETITNRLLRNGMPPEVKKWGQLKAWMQSNPMPPQGQQQLLNFQINQFRDLMERRQAAQGSNGALGGGPQQQQPQQQQQQHGAPGQQMQQNLGNLPPGFRFPPQAMQVTPADIQALRNDPRFATLDDQSLAKTAMKFKQEQFLRRLHLERMRKQQQEAQQQQLGLGNAPGSLHQLQGGPAPQATTSQPDMMNAPQAPTSQQAAQKPVASGQEPVTAGAKTSNNNANKTAQNRPAPPNPSPAAAAKNLKRSSPDDISEAPTTTNTANQRPNSQPAVRPMGPQPTPEMMASWTPEQRQKWEQYQRQRQAMLQPDPEEQKRYTDYFKTVNNEETLTNRDMPEIQMSAEERQEIEAKLPKLVSDLQKVSRGLTRWYWITHDDHRTRLFFRMRARVFQQFADDKLTKLKSSFSIRAADVNAYRTLLSSMGGDLAAHLTIPRKVPGNIGNAVEAAPAAAAAAAHSQSVAPAPQQAPLNPANLEKHTQAMSKVHQRSNSKSVQAPAAPTTTQPPFQFGAQKSPTGQPTYFNKPAVTQETLNPPPPARKKAKTGHQQASSPAIQQSGPSPQVKSASPEVKRQPQIEQPKAPSRPLFICPDTQCDMHSIGFPTKEALDAHHQEEHVKPYEDPIKYMEETVTKALGLDAQGNRIPKPGSADVTQPSALAMKANGSRQGQSLSKLDPVSTPMSRNASMGRQSSAQGGKSADSKGTPGVGGKAGQIKPESTPKPTMKQEPDQSQQAKAEDPWANSTVDPQALLATFAPLQPLINGHFSNFSPHRSRTPNDTPESSKDSGASEPNSDISERAQLDIDLKWAPLDLDSDLLVGLDSFSMGANSGLFADVGSEFPLLDELENEFLKFDNDKPFELDTSLYSMHCS